MINLKAFIWMMQGCIVIVQQKNHSYQQRAKNNVWGTQMLTESGW